MIATPEFVHALKCSSALATRMDLEEFQPNPAGKILWTDTKKPAHRFCRAVGK